jgi:hypothetical protein
VISEVFPVSATLSAAKINIYEGNFNHKRLKKQACIPSDAITDDGSV